MKVVIPVLGHGSRFKEENYELPKQLLPLAGEIAITLDLNGSYLHFFIRNLLITESNIE